MIVFLLSRIALYKYVMLCYMLTLIRLGDGKVCYRRHFMEFM